jgi:hypothetical protein
MLELEGISFDSKNQWVRCLAHIINLAVQSALTSLKAVPPNSEDDENNEIAANVISKVRVFVNNHIFCIKSILFL